MAGLKDKLRALAKMKVSDLRLGRRKGKSLVGYDGGNRRLKLVRIRGTQAPFHIEDAVIEVRTPEAIGGMRKLLAGRGYEKLPAAFSLADENVEVHSFKLPRLEKAELENAIAWELKKTVASEEYVVREVLTYERPDAFDIECIAAAKDVVLTVRRTGESFGLEPRYLETESSALAACVRGLNPERSLDRVAIIDLGYASFRLVFLHGGRVSFTRSLYFGIQSLCANVATQSEEQAPKVLETLETLGVGLGDGVVAKGLERGLQDNLYNLCEEFRRSEFFVKDKKGLDEIQDVFVCGGGAILNPVLPYLSEHFPDKKVTLLNPLATARVPEGLDPKTGPLWAVAVGLALREGP